MDVFRSDVSPPPAEFTDEEAEEEVTEESEPDSSDLSAEDSSWVTWFCSLRGNDFFCEVDEDYIQDDFNLTGLSSQVPYYDYALDTVLDMESSHADMLTEDQQDMVDSAAELLYGLIHARFILTSRGLQAMFMKFKDVNFGRCHRVYCQGQPVLPCGQSDTPRKTTVNVYCPRCNDLYFPKSSRQGNIDGAYFGTTFPHLFLMSYHAEIPRPSPQVYVPRVFGFRVHESSPAHIPNSRYEAEIALRSQIAARIKERRIALAKKQGKAGATTSALFEEDGSGGADGGAAGAGGAGGASGSSSAAGGAAASAVHDSPQSGAAAAEAGSGDVAKSGATATGPAEPSTSAAPTEAAADAGENGEEEQNTATKGADTSSAVGAGGGLASVPNGARATTAPAGASRGEAAPAPADTAAGRIPARDAWLAPEDGNADGDGAT